MLTPGSCTEPGQNRADPDDNILELRTADENALFRTCLHPIAMIGWHFISERFDPDFKEGDTTVLRGTLSNLLDASGNLNTNATFDCNHLGLLGRSG